MKERAVAKSASDAQLASDAIKALQDLKTTSTELSKLLRKVDLHIAQLGSLAQPVILQHGFLSLPPETLAHVRVLLRDMENERTLKSQAKMMKPNSSFPLVCRRFRELELDLPTLWTYVHVRMSLDRMRLQITRSGALGLTFAFHGSDVTELDHSFQGCRCGLWSLIAQNGHRWTTLDIHIRKHNSSGFPKDTDHNCIVALNNANFTSLRSLRLMAEGPNQRSVSIIGSWSLPVLQYLICDSPEDFLAIPVSENLERVELMAEMCPLRTDLVLNKFRTEAASRLTSLTLVIGTVWVPRMSSAMSNGVAMPLLKAVCIKPGASLVGGSYFIDVITSQLLLNIHSPNIETVSVSCRLRLIDLDLLADWISRLRNPALRKAHFIIHLAGRVTDDQVKSARRQFVQAFTGLEDRYSDTLVGDIVPGTPELVLQFRRAFTG